MRTLSTLFLMASFGLTALFILAGLEYVAGVPGQEVLTAWWSRSSGIAVGATLFFGSGFAVFALVFSTWAIAWLQILRGIPEQYVFLGPTLTRDKSYYYAETDPAKLRLTIGKRTGGFDFSLSSSIDALYTLHTMLRYGAAPEDAERAMAHNTRSQFMLVVFQYAALVFGLIALGRIVSDHMAAAGGTAAATPLLLSGATVLAPLLVIQFLGLVTGHMVLGTKIKRFEKTEYTKAQELGLRAGDTLVVALKKMGRERSSTGNKPFSSHYHVEWHDGGGQTVSAVFAFRATWKLRSQIEELDRATEREDRITCRVTDEFELRPVSLADNKNVDWI